MRFGEFGPASIKGAKIDWDVEVELGEEIVDALRPQDPDSQRPGRLRRAFVLRNHRGEYRAPKHGLVFAFPDGRWFLVQLDD
jgi:hypothetical protein